MGLKTAVSVAFLGATAAFAHTGVKDPTVMARMKLMESIGAETKVLGTMAKGAVAYDSARAEQARLALVSHAQAVAKAFDDPATDPMSEALPDIWERPDDFAKEVSLMERAALALDTTSVEGLRQTMGQLGQSCRSCHEGFRIDK